MLTNQEPVTRGQGPTQCAGPLRPVFPELDESRRLFGGEKEASNVKRPLSGRFFFSFRGLQVHPCEKKQKRT